MTPSLCQGNRRQSDEIFWLKDETIRVGWSLPKELSLPRTEFNRGDETMAKEHKGDSAPRQDQKSKGEHGGNRAGSHDKPAETSRSSQAAGKDPHRGQSQS
ncbi:hypothetical protein [Rhizobium laguerreae]|uniref:hypothetical protein n=1 Tax=Rhizobium laguerreae TaxID=1076926 RepID=UPI001C917A02|nr:hypothetical protein [Rhizobium laguerreae]MBY3390483.1 hypothetical protein [Rhizobium laguerreae]MBY3404143.1 hypothetical protein [Rhizobium laguerreae]MBY3411085.1 hypothetical protein [Rhizobium laguerreae]